MNRPKLELRRVQYADQAVFALKIDSDYQIDFRLDGTLVNPHKQWLYQMHGGLLGHLVLSNHLLDVAG